MSVELGCGLIAIGRPWGTTPHVPSHTEAVAFLEHAYEQGIRFFDTAPSYGLSEERLGSFLNTLSSEQRAEVTVATKFGEHWNSSSNEPYTDHSLDALKRSLDRSHDLLGKIAILQLHKATPETLDSSDVEKGFEYAEELGIVRHGVSVSDVATAKLAIANHRYHSIQLPYNAASPQFREPILEATSSHKELIINRPFQMGTITLDGSTTFHVAATNAFRVILDTGLNGVILTGTANPDHLSDNIAAFNEATS